MYGEGISRVGEVLDMGLKFGLLQKSGAWFYMGDERLGQGRDAAKQYFREHPEIMAQVEAQIIEKLKNQEQPAAKGEPGKSASAKAAPAAKAPARGGKNGSVEVFADDFEDD